MKLLMIEDNTSVAEMMAMFFQKEKWEVGFEGFGKQGVCGACTLARR